MLDGLLVAFNRLKAETVGLGSNRPVPNVDHNMRTLIIAEGHSCDNSPTILGANHCTVPQIAPVSSAAYG